MSRIRCPNTAANSSGGLGIFDCIKQERPADGLEVFHLTMIDKKIGQGDGKVDVR